MERRPVVHDPLPAARQVHVSGPGTRLLVEHLGWNAPHAELAARHLPGDRAYRLARALSRTAAELDDAYCLAQRAGGRLREDRAVIDDAAGRSAGVAIQEAAHELEQALQCCELVDTALVRLLAAYLDLVSESGQGHAADGDIGGTCV
ncbi:hypothetical protein [Streptomyces sp. N35]|uniref:hypothetical protein n=1 Tax=Streptomyces sp. N35 TaxID=2795730 RepID=UPI0018F2AD0F|nr:hypothetical protein [Streptomyces sp. N35]